MLKYLSTNCWCLVDVELSIPMLVVVGFPLVFLLHLPLLRRVLVGSVMYYGALLLSYLLLLRSQGWTKGDRAAYDGDSRNLQVIYYRNVRKTSPS